MSEPVIQSLVARRIWDSRGRPTVEAEVTLSDGAMGRGIAPAGASRGTREALDKRDGGKRFGGFDVQDALRGIRAEIAPALVGLDPFDQAAIDARLVALDGTPNKARLGGNALTAVSLGVLHAAAASRGLPLWRYCLGDKPAIIPLPEIQIFGGGAHAGRRTDVQDFMVMAPRAKSFAEALEVTAEVYHSAGRAHGRARPTAGRGRRRRLVAGVLEQRGGARNADAGDRARRPCAGRGRRRSRSTSPRRNSAKAAGTVWASNSVNSTATRWPKCCSAGATAIRSCRSKIRSPRTTTKGSRDSPPRSATACRSSATIFSSPTRRVREAARRRSVNAVLIKVNQAGTVSEAKAACDEGRRAGFGTIVSARSGETEDTSIAHLAVGWGAGQLKVGSFARSERMAKWNEVLRIEEALGSKARFAGLDEMPMRRQAMKPVETSAGWRV